MLVMGVKSGISSIRASGDLNTLSEYVMSFVSFIVLFSNIFKKLSVCTASVNTNRKRVHGSSTEVLTVSPCCLNNP